MFKFNKFELNLNEIIGRSVVVKTENSNELFYPIACGIIARSAGIFENYKKICACDGVTLWDERDVPIAGVARQKKN